MRRYEFDLWSDFALPSLAELEDTYALIDSLTFTPTHPIRTRVQFYGSDPDTIESVLDWDHTVADARRLDTDGTQNTYYVYHDPETIDVVTTKAAVEFGAEFCNARTTGDSWTIEVAFPSPAGLEGFRDQCDNLGVRMEVADTPTFRRLDPAGLTPRQRETLQIASDRGYFSVPRETTLAELAETLGVSDQAVSERIRRGVDALVQHRVADDGSLAAGTSPRDGLATGDRRD